MKDRQAGGIPPWLWGLPLLGMLLVLLAVAVLLWLLQRSDDEDQRTALISDVLWVEQDLRFHLEKLQDLLEDLGRDTATGKLGAEPMEARMRFLIKSHPWVSQIVSYDANMGVNMEVPPDGDAAIRDLDAFQLAGFVAKPVFAAPRRNPDGEAVIELHVPYFHQNQLAAMTVAVISLDSLLRQGVPWWYAERYQLRILDLGGDIVASRSRVEVEASAASHRIAFDPPGHGLFLEATPYQQQTNLVRNGLAVAIVLLMLMVLWSMHALRRHARNREAAEAALREQFAFRQAMEDSLQTGLRARDLKGGITYVNPAFCRMVGWSAEDLVGQHATMPYWIDEEIDIAQGWNARILAGQAPLEGFEIRFRRRNGEIFWALIHEAPLVDAQGQQTGWMGSIVDITPQKQAEERERQQLERLQATARLVTMGEMASSLAHELNQPLAAISSYTAGSLNLIDSGQTSLEEIRGALAKAQEQAQRAGRIIRRIYEFVRRAEPKSEPCRVGELIEEITDLVEVDAQRLQVRIVREIADDLPTLQGDRVLLGQALLNLMRNGIEAMRNCPARPCLLVVRAALAADQVRIDIIDRGPGIPPETAARLFEPFFTTKQEGMGMGLNIARSVVEAHRGRLWLEPNPEGGSVFMMTLPVELP